VRYEEIDRGLFEFEYRLYSPMNQPRPNTKKVKTNVELGLTA